MGTILKTVVPIIIYTHSNTAIPRNLKEEGLHYGRAYFVEFAVGREAEVTVALT